MITDREANFTYLSSLLKQRHDKLFDRLTWHLDKYHIQYGLLPKTSDIWAVDYMPIQVRTDYFVQFKYDPDYLKPQKWRPLKTDQDLVCSEIGIKTEKYPIVLDGGNVVRVMDKIIMTTKVFKENPGLKEDILKKRLEELFEVANVIIVPQEPRDYVGHADGMVRFVDENTVLVNEYPSDKKVYIDFALALRSSLRNAGLKVYEMPYIAWRNGSADDARGCYINYLEVGDFIFYPVYDLFEDMTAFNQLETLFPGRTFVDINCNDLAQEGGVLNCISWNILKTF